MKITKWVEFSKEVEVTLSAEDIHGVLLEEPMEGKAAALRLINSAARGLKAIPQEFVNEFNQAQRSSVAAFLREQAVRFEAVGVEVKL